MKLSSALLAFCKEHENDDVHLLALKSGLYPNIDMAVALQQIEGRQRAKNKLPSWYACDNVIYPKHLSMEQCSSESTALYKKSLCQQGSEMVDLTGGLGVDISYMSDKFKHATYIEQIPELFHIAQHNFSVLGKANVSTYNTDAVEYLQQMNSKVDLIYIDPARRDTKGRKTVLIEDCTPNLIEIQAELAQKATKTIIKLAPMLDISLALTSLNNISDVHIVSVDNECKELLFVKGTDFAGETKYHCVNVDKNTTNVFSFTKREEEIAMVSYSLLDAVYLYEPNTSILKAGGYRSVSERFSVQKLHISSHLYTSINFVDSFPGRQFRIKTISTLNKKELKESLLDIKNANITVRNFPMKVDELRKKLKLKDGGDTYIFATTISDNKKVLIICEKL